MSIKSLRTSGAAAMGGAVLLAGLVVGASIALADDTNEPRVVTEGETLDECGRHLRENFHLLRGQLDEIVEELGLDLDQIREQIAEGDTLAEIAEGAGIDLDSLLNEARNKALEHIDDRVAAGDMTEEQADAIRERIEDFDPNEFNFDFKSRAMPRLGGLFGDLLPDIDLSELRDKLESGVALDEALEELDVDVEGLLEQVRAAALSHIDELVTDGIITQERADELKEMIEDFELGEGLPFGPRGFHFEFDGDRFGGFDFDGFRGPHRHGRGFFGDGNDANVENARFSA